VKGCAPAYLLLFLLSFFSLNAQSLTVDDAPWSEEEMAPPRMSSGGPVFYLPLEFLGGNIMNEGVGVAFLDRRLDIQFQGAFSHLRSENRDGDWSIEANSFTLGGDISHHFPLKSGRFGLYYGLLYRYNHMMENTYADMPDSHWTGLSLGGEFHRNERLTFYGETLVFIQNLYVDLPALSLAGGVKLWLF